MTEAASDAPLHGDLTQRVVVDTTRLTWTSSPGAGVMRKRLHRVGPAEAGQVTSLVRYAPGARFPAHDHPEGEEILVLEGVFSDEHGDWPAGTYLLNPEGFRHAPYSREGCLLFVKLRQAPGAARRHVALRTDALAWAPTEHPAIARKVLADQPEYADVTVLERWSPGADPGALEHAGGAEMLVLEGALEDEAGCYDTWTWLRLPAGHRHRPRSRSGCVLYAKYGSLSILWSAGSGDVHA
ncbi:MAG TPA: anti-sigma factor [Alphaproteobacteria bacterium]|nr:anti-sigma factor [Alphaproteobacteria bacterium]